MKGEYPYGERNILCKMPNVTLVSFGQETFVDPRHIKLEQIEQAGQALMVARKAILSGEYDLVVLDEINVALNLGLLKEKQVLEFLDSKPEGVEVILTGRYAPESILARADLVTEMVCRKHYYDSGVRARKGIEK